MTPVGGRLRMTVVSRPIVSVILALGLVATNLLLEAQPTYAAAPTCTVTWTGTAGDGAWLTASNWNPGHAPAAADYACVLSTAGAITVAGSNTILGVDSEGAGLSVSGSLSLTDTTQDSIINALTLNGFVGGAAKLTIKGATIWNSGSLGGSGTVVNGGTVAIATNASVAVLGNLVNQGTVRQPGGNAPTVCLQDGVTLENAGTFDISGIGVSGLGGSCGAGSGTGRLLNDANATITGNGTITSLFDNNGLVTLGGGGSLNIRNGNSPGQSDAGTYQTVAGQGSINLAGGTRSFAGATIAGGDALGTGVTLIGGTLTGTLTLSGDMYWGTTFQSAGTFSGATLNGPGRLHLSTDQTLALAGNLVNHATFEGEYRGFSNGFCLDDGATLENAGTMSIPTGGVGVCNGNSGTSALQNDAGATLTAAYGINGATISTPFSNAGTLQLFSGTLSISGRFSNFDSNSRTLTGGSYQVLQSPTQFAELRFAGADVVTLAATVVVDGRDARVADPSHNNAFRDLATITSVGSLTLRNDPAPIVTTGSLSNDGTLVLGAGTRTAISLGGGLSEMANATLHVETGSASLGTLSAVGTASLNGILAIDTPGAGAGSQTFTVLSAASVNGTFASVVGSALPNGLSFQVRYRAGEVDLFVAGPSFAALFSNTAAIPATWPGTLPAPQGQSTNGITLPFTFAGVQFDLHQSATQQVLVGGDSTGAKQFCVDGQWVLSLVGPARQSVPGSGCHAPIDFSQLGLPDGLYGVQMTLTAPVGATTLGTSNIYLVTANVALLTVADNFRPQPLGIRFPIQLTGNLNAIVGTSGTLNVILGPTLLPIGGIHLPVFPSYDPTGVTATSFALAPEWHGWIGDGITEYGPGKSSGTVLTAVMTCLQPGTWPVTFTGNYWLPGAPTTASYADSVSGSATVTCTAPPGSPPTAGAGVSINPADGTVTATITGSSFGAATSAQLIDTTGAVGSISLSVTVDPSGTSATAHFPQTAPGLFDLKLVSSTGSVITTTTGGALELPPALPLFNVNQVDAVSNVPGFPTTHLWNVQNRGTIDGTAVLAFGFPSYFSPEPVFIASAAPPGSRLLAHGLTSDAWIEYVAIPMQSGRSGDVAWTTVLPPAALTGPAPPTTIGAPLPFTYDLSGQFTAPEWTSVAGQAPGRIVDAAFATGQADFTAALGAIVRLRPAARVTYLQHLRTSDLAVALATTVSALESEAALHIAGSTGGLTLVSNPSPTTSSPAPAPPSDAAQPGDSLGDPMATFFGNFSHNTFKGIAAGYSATSAAGLEAKGPSGHVYLLKPPSPAAGASNLGVIFGDAEKYHTGYLLAQATVVVPSTGAQALSSVTAVAAPASESVDSGMWIGAISSTVTLSVGTVSAHLSALPFEERNTVTVDFSASFGSSEPSIIGSMTVAGLPGTTGTVSLRSTAASPRDLPPEIPAASTPCGIAQSENMSQLLWDALLAAGVITLGLIALSGVGTLLWALAVATVLVANLYSPGPPGVVGTAQGLVDVFHPLWNVGVRLIFDCNDSKNSLDPNEITASPLGVGVPRWTKAEPMRYLIHFENSATATAPAQNVRVTLTLDPNLDPATIRFGDSSFAGTHVSFDPGTATLSWVLPGINLPPDTAPPAGEAWMTFAVAPRAGLATGTTISETAQVFFDYNPPLATPAVARTIDVTPPQSHVSALPANETASTFSVSWSGTDTGAGIVAFAVYSSDNGGPFLPWLHDTTASSATYVGQTGHTYAFYSQATDAVGNVEPAHTAPDTTTTVSVGTNPASAISVQQYALPNSDGATWVEMDPTNLRVPFTPAVDSLVIISANADLWTSSAGINQDLGIALSGGAYPTVAGQPEAWKESGGFAGTFSPNAAYAQAIVRVNAGTPYIARLQWKTNRPAGGRTIYAAAGSNGVFSPTRLTVRLVPLSPSTVANAAITTQPRLSGSDGAVWRDIDAGLSAPFTPTANGFVIASSNADLWTSVAGYNQDLGITVSGGTYPTTAGQPEAWKESGGFAGTYSPNAAFVQTVVPVVANTPYTFKLQWKTNKSSPATATIWAGAGPINGQFSPTRLALQFVPSGTSVPGVVEAVSTQQHTQAGSDGVTWVDMDSSSSTPLTLNFSSTTSCVAVLGANADLWTSVAGYNQDIGLSLNGALVAWKESGGFAGTFSPNAAYVQSVIAVIPGTVYTLKVQWKTNRSSPSTAAIWAGAGPIGTKFSPTRVSATLVGCQ